MNYSVTLPPPPSVNTYWRTFRGRMIVSAKGREYRQAVANVVQWRELRPMFEGPVAVELTFCPPDKRRRDLDNLLKATFDALTSAGVWGDDNQVNEFTVRRGKQAKGGQLRVSVRKTVGADDDLV